MGSIDFAFPAGAESDVSSDEWDLGFPEKKPQISKNKDLDPAPANCNQVSLLKLAISKGEAETVGRLIDNGLHVDTRLDSNDTPLMCAVSRANSDLTEILLERGASANFSKDHWTVLMACCSASAPEDDILRCLKLLLSRNADPNMTDRSHMTCLMLASRDGLSKVLNLLVSHGAHTNTQDLNGFTALCYAAQHGRESSVLKLLELGVDKTLKTKKGSTALDLAAQFKHTQIVQILMSTPGQCPKRKPSVSEDTWDSANKLDELELLFHGLGLSSLADILTDHDISWNELLTMDKNDLSKIGITDPGDQQKVLTTVQRMELDKVDLEALSDLGGANPGSEELHTFLLSVKQQCSYLTETIQDVVARFPRRASQLVFSLDSKGEAQSVCNQLLIQTKDLQQEVALLRNLLSQSPRANAGSNEEEMKRRKAEAKLERICSETTAVKS